MMDCCQLRSLSLRKHSSSVIADKAFVRPYFRASYQLDYWHLLRKMRQTFPDKSSLVAELEGYLRSGKGKELLNTANLAKLLCEDEERRAKIVDLASYIEGKLDCLYSARALKAKIKAK